MKSLLLAALITASCFTLSAKEISPAQAEKYAIAAYKLYAKDNRKSDISIESNLAHTTGDRASYYFFNITGGGFVILSAEDSYYPVLGFSTQERIDLRRSEALKTIVGELSRHENQIVLARSQNFKSNTKATSSWSAIKEVAQTGRVSKSFAFQPTVAPLTTTKWNQSGLYNESCPADPDGPDGRTYCGCLPIALSQLLRYYENPAPGNGSLSYEDPIYGTQSVDLCGEPFDYANMPDTLAESNKVLADFIYDVGKITQTSYSTYYTSTYVSRLEDALVYNFGFDSDVKSYHGTDQAKYSEVMRSELDEGRIVFLSGWSIDEQEAPDIGHTWLGDGYGYTDTGVEYMHFNWGWGGSNNGWFLDVPGLWTPHEDNPEQDAITYYWYRFTVYNIKPSGENCSPAPAALSRAEPAENYAYLYFQTVMRDELKQFRYRETGDSEWINPGPTESYFIFASGLKPGTTYEYQVARNCCGGWSSFSDTEQFLTEGGAGPDPDPDPDPDTNVDCATEATDGFFVTSVTDNFAYVYTSRPHGAVNNEFRYKKVNSSTWTQSNISSSHYRGLAGLDGGSTYEYQVRHECATDSWSDYSNSYEFTTSGMSTDNGDGDGGDGGDSDGDMDGGNDGDGDGDMNGGDSDSNCPTIATGDVAVGYATSSGATAYLLRVSGGQMYRFRIRATGSTGAWTVGSETTITSQNFSGLSSNTSYDIQVGQNCGSGWSEYSGSQSISTLQSN